MLAEEVDEELDRLVLDRLGVDEFTVFVVTFVRGHEIDLRHGWVHLARYVRADVG